MSRRTFIQKLFNGIKSMALFQMMAATGVLTARTSTLAQGLHYRPLNGTSLRTLAANKVHHGRNGRFINPLGNTQGGRGLSQVLRWKLFGNNKFASYLAEQPLKKVQVDWAAVKQHRGVSVTFVKHGCVLIKDGPQTLLIDPVFDDMFGWIKDFTPIGFDIDEMPRPDHILITHGHYDHLNTSTLSRFDDRTHVIAPLGYHRIFNRLGMQRRTHLDWYDVYTNGHWEITLLPCNHWTMRNPLSGPNCNLWGSFLIKTATGKTIYVSGDTAYFDGFDQIGRQFDIDLAIMNLGAYEPRWFMAPSHMNPQEVVDAFKLLNAEQLMIVHWGTYQLGDEPVHFPPMHLRQILEKEDLLEKWVDLKHGGSYFL